MRIRELYEASPTDQGIYDKNQDRRLAPVILPSRKPPLTLRHLNRLKHIRNVRRKAQQEKLAFLPSIYGNADRVAAQAENSLEEINLIKDQIALEIEAANIDRDKKDHISVMAMRAIERKRKT